MSTTYKIITRDTDGQSARTFKTLAGAMKRFEEMAGHSLEDAIREQFYAANVPPTVRAVASVRTVSTYGTVVVFCRIGDAESEPVVIEVADDNDPDGEPHMHDGMEDGPRNRYEAIPHPCDDDIEFGF